MTIEQGSDPDPTVSGFATPGTCVVYLTPAFLSQQPEAATVCAVVVHEFGHLLGLDHSPDENNVMFPRPLPPPACLRGARSPADDTPTRAEEFHVESVAGSAQQTTGSELLSRERPSAKRRASRRSRMCARASTRRAEARSRSVRRARRRACKPSA